MSYKYLKKMMGFALLYIGAALTDCMPRSQGLPRRALFGEVV